MKPEYTTVYGKVIIEYGKLYIRNVDIPISHSLAAKLIFELCFPLTFFLQFYKDEGSKKIVGIIVFGILFLSHLGDLYDLLFKRSYANRIPLDRIQSLTTSDDNNGLQTYVTLHLKNGRYRKVAFRKLENQYQPFIDLLSQFIIHPQLA